jgi:hypothetical protein
VARFFNIIRKNGDNKLELAETGQSSTVSFCEHANKAVKGGNILTVILYKGVCFLLEGITITITNPPKCHYSIFIFGVSINIAH